MELNKAIEKLNSKIEKFRDKDNSITYRKEDLWDYLTFEDYKAIDTVLNELDNRIPRKDIEDLKEKIHWELDKNGITRGYQIIIDGYFNKLLNKE